jgi:hypothetical protein
MAMLNLLIMHPWRHIYSKLKTVFSNIATVIVNNQYACAFLYENRLGSRRESDRKGRELGNIEYGFIYIYPFYCHTSVGV